MKCHDPLKTILSQGRLYWERDEMRPAVRRVFDEAMRCRTPELGAVCRQLPQGWLAR